MSKVTFEFDGVEEGREVQMVSHIYDMAVMLDDIDEYTRHLRKYETRGEIPVEEIEEKLSDIIHKWRILEG